MYAHAVNFNFAGKISAADKAKIKQLIADIKAGKIKDLPKIQ